MTPNTAKSKYFEAVGRRKTAVARVRLFPDKETSYEINGRTLESYFAVPEHRATAAGSMVEGKPAEKFSVSVRVSGGGASSQAEAVRHGIARALTVYDAELRGRLKKAGYLKRDSRAKERRKFGLKKARKAPQWSKR